MSFAAQKIFAEIEDKKSKFVNKDTDLSKDPGNEASNNFLFREIYTHNYMHVLLNETSLNKIVNFIVSKNTNYVLEVCAGMGLLAALIKSYGVPVIATDILHQSEAFFYENNTIKLCSNDFSIVEQMSSVCAVKRFPTNILICCWPSPNALRYCLPFYKGKYIIYIGELGGEACETQLFFNELEESFNCIDEVEILNFYDMHDRCLIYERRA